VEVTGEVKDATTCQLELLSKQSLQVVYSTHGRPCSSTFTAHIFIGPNRSAVHLTIVFGLVARNRASISVAHFSVDVAGPPPTTTTTPVPFDATPALQWPTSLFDRPVVTWAIDTSSAQFVSNLVTDYRDHYGSVGVNTVPIYTVPAGQPDVTVSVAPGCNRFTSATGQKIPIPGNVALAGSSDSPLVIWQPSSHLDWELWQVSRQTATAYSACWGGKLSTVTSDGVFPSPYGLSATGISYLAVTITEADIASGSIDHAVGMVVPRCNYSVYPADRTDCRYDPGQPGEGQWFRFAPGTPMPPGLTPFAQMVFQAIETYGAVVTDQGGGVEIEAEQASDWAAEGHTGTDPITASWDGLPGYEVVASLPWPDLQVVDPPR
jgi:hypothetical protein